MTLTERFEALIPRLETERLILRGFRPSDFESYAEYSASERAKGTGGPAGRVDAWRSFGHMAGHWMLRGYGFFVLEEKASGQAIGTCGPYFPEGWPEREIGWTLWGAQAEGKGYAYEAALAARGFAYETLGWDTVISMILDGNTRSEQLAQRMGCTRDGGFMHEKFGAASIWRHPSPADLGDGGMEAYA